MALNLQQTYTSIPEFILQTLPGDFLNEYSLAPDTHNLLTNNKFQFFIGRCPRLSFFSQRVNVPSLSFGTSIQSNPTGISSRRPGTSYVYDDLQVGFVVDENLTSWLEVHNWMIDLGINYRGDTEKFVPNKPRESQKVSSASLLILNSNYKPIINYTFKNVYPTILSGIDFDSSQTDTDPIIAAATFAYTHYEVQVLTNP
jgi:hypothetical protein